MSSWWEITFCATGELSKLKILEDALSGLFHSVIEIHRTGGVLITEALQNYGGQLAMELAIRHYPHLTFNGLLVHEQAAQPGGTYYLFTGIGGVPEWQEFSTPVEDEYVMTPDEVEAEI
jgi:hypothetical protein